MQQIKEYSYLARLLKDSPEFQRWPKEKQREALKQMDEIEQKGKTEYRDHFIKKAMDDTRAKLYGESCGIFSSVAFI